MSEQYICHNHIQKEEKNKKVFKWSPLSFRKNESVLYTYLHYAIGRYTLVYHIKIELVQVTISLQSIRIWCGYHSMWKLSL